MTVDVKKTIRQTIVRHGLIAENGHVVLGLSGGPDSMCLFHVLLDLRKELGFTMSTVHLNHRFRPGEAEKDQKYVEKICKDNGIKCLSKTLDINRLASERGETPEEAGRNERYKAFDEEAQNALDSGKSDGKTVIAVAQNRNDQVETVLMRILRGTGTNGLSGIPYKRESEGGFDVVRPLLDVDRESIEVYCSEHEIRFRTDHTNLETEHHRNKIRLDLLPMLRSEYNRNVDDALIRLSRSASMDNEFFDKKINTILEENCQFDGNPKDHTASALIESRIIADADPAIGTRLISMILKNIGLAQGLEASHIEASYNSIRKNRTGASFEFPQGYRMRISYSTLRFFNEFGIEKFVPFEPQSIFFHTDDGNDRDISLPGGVLKIRMGDNYNIKGGRNILVLDRDALKNTGLNLTVRSRNPGDRMRIKGMNGTKKIQDILVDAKVAADRRNTIPLITLGDEILWMAGLRNAGIYLAVKSTKHRLSLEWEPKN